MNQHSQVIKSFSFVVDPARIRRIQDIYGSIQIPVRPVPYKDGMACYINSAVDGVSDRVDAVHQYFHGGRKRCNTTKKRRAYRTKLIDIYNDTEQSIFIEAYGIRPILTTTDWFPNWFNNNSVHLSLNTSLSTTTNSLLGTSPEDEREREYPILSRYELITDKRRSVDFSR